MKYFKYILVLFFISYTFLATAQESTNYFLHTIERGQSLHSISSMYGINKEDIIRLNPGCEEKIYAGHTLKIPQSLSKNPQAQKDIFHTIQPGETLYRLSIKYNVAVKDIIEENPGLSAQNFKIGEVIRIPHSTQKVEIEPEVAPVIVQTTNEIKPRCQDMHKVKRKETIFSISRQYNISEKALKEANPELENGMKKGQLICIPYPQEERIIKKEESVLNAPSNTELFRASQEVIKKIPVIKAAIILPFSPEGVRRSESTRMIEFYEGFLLAVDSLKRQGVSLDLHVFDSGSESKSLASILAKEELKQMHLIIGPLYQQHIKPLADFADQHHIRLVIPFTSKDNEVFQNPYVYQVNTPQSYLYSEVYSHFLYQFANANVIILQGATSDKENKIDFANGLRLELVKKGIPSQTIYNINSANLRAALHSEKENVFISTSASELALIKLVPQLTLLAKHNPKHKISFFGYPEWQTYTKDHLDSFFELNTYFYSSFYTNNLLPSAVNFIKNYHRWYSKEMANTFPKYGMLGFDVGYFFLKGLSTYGTGFEYNLSKMNLTPIQTGFKFERANNWGGFINKKVFFINFTKNYELLKLDFD